MIRMSINRYCTVNNISQIFVHKFNTGFPCQMWADFILKTLSAISFAILKLLFLTGPLVLLCLWSFLILQRKLNAAFSFHISNLTIQPPKLCISLQIYNFMGKFGLACECEFSLKATSATIFIRTITSKFILILIARHNLMGREFCLIIKYS